MSETRKIPTDRECRCETQKWAIDEKKTGVLKFADQALRRDGDILISDNKLLIHFNLGGCGGCYPDDVLGVIRDIYESFPDKDDATLQIIKALNMAIQVADIRAMKKHGYYWSKEEADYVPPYIKEIYK